MICSEKLKKSLGAASSALLHEMDVALFRDNLDYFIELRECKLAIMKLLKDSQ